MIEVVVTMLGAVGGRKWLDLSPCQFPRLHQIQEQRRTYINTFDKILKICPSMHYHLLHGLLHIPAATY